jgi:hypothetical protein
VYDIRRRGEDRLALLFVVDSSRKFDVSGSPPITKPQLQTQGYVTGVWVRRFAKSDQLLYVLVVEGSHDRYRGLLRRESLATKVRSSSGRKVAGTLPRAVRRDRRTGITAPFDIRSQAAARGACLLHCSPAI